MDTPIQNLVYLPKCHSFIGKHQILVLVRLSLAPPLMFLGTHFCLAFKLQSTDRCKKKAIADCSLRDPLVGIGKEIGDIDQRRVILRYGTVVSGKNSEPQGQAELRVFCTVQYHVYCKNT